MLGFFCIFAIMKIGSLSINVEAHKDWTFEQFNEAYKGKLNRDINEVWKEICKLNKVESCVTKKELGLDESINKPSKQSKKS